MFTRDRLSPSAFLLYVYKSTGLDAHIMPVETLLSYPASKGAFNIISPSELKFEAGLVEKITW